MCDTAAMMGRPASLGAMGIHYFRPDLLGITAPPSPRVNGVGTHTDFRRPSILIYEPQEDGAVELVAVENLVFALASEPVSQKTGECLDARCVFRPLIRDLARGVAVVEIGNHHRSDRFFGGAGLNRLRGK